MQIHKTFYTYIYINANCHKTAAVSYNKSASADYTIKEALLLHRDISSYTINSVHEDQFTSPYPCPRTLSLSLDHKVLENSRTPHPANTLLCIMYDHVKSINSVTASMHEVMAKNGLLVDIRYYLLTDQAILHCNPV